MKKISAIAVFALCLSAFAALHDDAFAQNYPNKPIRLIVPYIAGGATDVLAREVSQKLKEILGQPVVIENKPGASGNIGTELVAKAPKDGYTLLLGTQGTHGINSTLYDKLPYDPVKDFVPVSLLGTIANVLVVNPSIPVNSVKELIALAKSKPGKLNFASSGSGLAPHLSGALFKSMAGIDTVHVAYNGSVPAMTAVLNGEADYIFQMLPTALPQVKAGKVKALAVSSAKRSAILPDLPTVSEAGVPGYELVAWFGIMAPAGVPKEITARLNSEIVKIMEMPDVKGRLLEQGIEPVTCTQEYFADYIKKELVVWGKVVKDSGARVN